MSNFLLIHYDNQAVEKVIFHWSRAFMLAPLNKSIAKCFWYAEISI